MNLPTRKSPRLKGYDYSNENYYYVTLCTHAKKCIFGAADQLNAFGKIARQELVDISSHFNGIQIDKFVIMPNHIHAIIIVGCVDDIEKVKPFPTLSLIIGLYKSGVTKKIHDINPETEVWQKSFYDEVIRCEQGYRKIWEYIDGNPLLWQLDEYHASL